MLAVNHEHGITLRRIDLVARVNRVVEERLGYILVRDVARKVHVRDVRVLQINLARLARERLAFVVQQVDQACTLHVT